MTAIQVYSPRDADLHLSLPHDHANSVFTTSPFTYKLNDKLDFIEIFPAGERTTSQMALDPMFISALFWAVHRTKQIINWATRGAVPTIGVNALIPDELFDNLGMKKPRLVTLLKQTDINPLRCFGDRVILKQIVHGLQQLGREAIDWMIEARWQSQLLGNCSLWDWEDPRTLHPLSALLGNHPLGLLNPPNSPMFSSSSGSEPDSPTTPFLSSPNYSPASILLPFDPNSSRPSLPTDSIHPIRPTSPTNTQLPFSMIQEEILTGREEDVKLMLQLVLHPTTSCYALRYPLANVFGQAPLIENGYISADEDCAMEVDEE